jgi:HIRAN domain
MGSVDRKPLQGSSKRRRETSPNDDYPDPRNDWAPLGFAGRPLSCPSILIVDCKIVGVRYYLGIVSLSESLDFIRDPDNPHDPNAIRVDNSRGWQVGQYYRLPNTWLTIESSPRLGCHSGAVVRQRGAADRGGRGRCQ